MNGRILRGVTLGAEAVPIAQPEPIGNPRQDRAQDEAALAIAAATAQAREWEEAARVALKEAAAHLERARQAESAAAADLSAAKARAEEQAQEHAQAQARRLDAIARTASDAFAARLDALEDDAVVLCHGVICKMLGEAMATPAGVAAVVRQALAQLREEPVRIALHPDDLALLDACGPAARTRLAQVEWVGDASLELGGARIASARSSLDASTQTQLASLRAALARARRGAE